MSSAQARYVAQTWLQIISPSLYSAHAVLLLQGILEPNTTTAVQVMMQAQKDYPPDMSNCKDKFLVQTVQLLPGQDLEADTFRGDVSCAAA
jgi:hypothetical protein